MQTALGGAEKIASVRDFEESVRAQTWTQSGDVIGTVRKRTRWISPSYLRLDQVGPGDTYVLYFDGRGGWENPAGQNGRGSCWRRTEVCPEISARFPFVCLAGGS